MTYKALAVQPANDIDTMSLGSLLAKSGYFQDAKDAAQAVVKVLAGRELGLGPIASMTGVYIVKGRPALSANLLAGVLKKSGRYNYRVIALTAERAEIAFFERNGNLWDEIGRSVFTIEDARKAGTQNLDRFARNMLFARAMTNGIRWYCPDVFSGGVYTPEELGAPVDGEGEPMQAEQPAVVIEQAQPAANGNGHNGNGHKPATLSLEQAKRAITDAGLEWGEFAARQRALGFTGYNAERDTVAVQTFIAIIAEQPGEGGAQ